MEKTALVGTLQIWLIKLLWNRGARHLFLQREGSDAVRRRLNRSPILHRVLDSGVLNSHILWNIFDAFSVGRAADVWIEWHRGEHVALWGSHHVFYLFQVQNGVVFFTHDQVTHILLLLLLLLTLLLLLSLLLLLLELLLFCRWVWLRAGMMWGYSAFARSAQTCRRAMRCSMALLQARFRGVCHRVTSAALHLSWWPRPCVSLTLPSLTCIFARLDAGVCPTKLLILGAWSRGAAKAGLASWQHVYCEDLARVTAI